MTTFWNERKVLVTGTTGLVGCCLVKALIERKAHVIAFIRDPNSHRANFTEAAIATKLKSYKELLRILTLLKGPSMKTRSTQYFISEPKPL